MASFLPVGLLDTIGALQETAYDRTCYVQALTSVQDPVTLEWSETWADAGGPFPCSVNPRPGAEAVRAAQLVAENPVLVKLDAPEGLAVTAEHRVRVEASDTAPALTLTVVSVEDVQGRGRWLHLACTQTG